MTVPTALNAERRGSISSPMRSQFRSIATIFRGTIKDTLSNSMANRLRRVPTGTSSRCSRRPFRRVQRLTSLLLFVWLLLASSRSAHGYSVLSHEQLIDLSWNSTIVPILLSHYPLLTTEQLRQAHAFAYGGCVIQDLGYYPFGHALFSNLTHYVRSGDFVQSLFRNAHSADELAFAIGALSHYIGDSIGHSQATNPSVALSFPKLRAEFGSLVNYAQDKNAHGQVEFAFDINQIVKNRLPPAAYLHFIGLKVPQRQLAEAFYETYGLNIGGILGLYHPTLRTYRFGVRSFLPAFAYAEALLHPQRLLADTPGPEIDVYEQHMAQLHREAEWHRYRKKPGVGTYMLAGLIVILPKIGPIAMLSIKGPTADTEQCYIESVNLSTAALGLVLEQFAARYPTAGQTTERARLEGLRKENAELSPPAALDPPSAMRYSQPLPSSLVPNRDLDTGARVVPGGYPLTDETYAKLLTTVTEHPTKPIPAKLKEDIFNYYADPDAPISTKRSPKKWDQVQKHLKLLTSIPTRAEPELAFP